jgi:hypothetical protein
VAFGCLWAGGLLGCTADLLPAAGELTIASRDRGKDGTFEIAGLFDRAIYSIEDRNRLTVVLIDGPAEEPRRVALVTMLWRARAGLTPIDRTATNASVRFLDLPDDGAEPRALGLYAGGGFLRLHDDPTTGQLDGTLRQFDLRLTDRSENYVDRLGRAVLAGRFTARRDDAAVAVILRGLNQNVTDRLGYPRLVRSLDASPAL